MIEVFLVKYKSEIGFNSESFLFVEYKENKKVCLKIEINGVRYEASEKHVFIALLVLRRDIEKLGFYLCINGSRRDVYQKGSQMSVFGLWDGIQFVSGRKETNVINLLGECYEKLTTVEQQKINYCCWIQGCVGEVVKPSSLRG